MKPDRFRSAHDRCGRLPPLLVSYEQRRGEPGVSDFNGAAPVFEHRGRFEPSTC
ncbi:hypothetical protein ACWGRF_31155 [Streptomyces zhihengii]